MVEGFDNYQRLCAEAEVAGHSVGLRTSPETFFLIKHRGVRWKQIVAVEVYDGQGEVIKCATFDGIDHLDRAAKTLLAK